jgi:hypothetical protein
MHDDYDGPDPIEPCDCESCAAFLDDLLLGDQTAMPKSAEGTANPIGAAV